MTCSCATDRTPCVLAWSYHIALMDVPVDGTLATGKERWRIIREYTKHLHHAGVIRHDWQTCMPLWRKEENPNV